MMQRKPFISNFLDDASYKIYRRAVFAKAVDGGLMGIGIIAAFTALTLYVQGASASLVVPALIAFNTMLFGCRFVLGRFAITRCYKTTFDASVTLRRRVLNHLTQLPLGAFKRLHPGRVAQTLSEDTMWSENEAAHFYGSTKAETVAILLLFFAVLLLHWPAAVAALGFWAAALLMIRKIRISLDRGLKYRSEGFAEAAKHFSDYAIGMPVIRSVGANQTARRDFDKWVEKMHAGFVGGIKRHTPMLGAVQALSMAAVGVGALVTMFTLPEAPSIFRIIAALGLLLATLIPARTIMVNNMVASIAKRGEINTRDILATAVLKPGSDMSISGPIRIELENASFTYPQTSNGVRDLSFVAEPGTITAIVGPSGAGKSTLANLLLRFWDVDAGQIRADGIDIRSLDAASYMGRCAAVFQQTQLFEDSVMENIRVGRPGANDMEVFAAAQAAQIHDTILTLPDGYDTVVAANGTTLSGGERQRVTLARALLKDADLIILDEATSALDPENERDIQQAFETLAAGKTVFIIAHRLSTITRADQILVMDQGEIVARGTHHELMDNCALYQTLWDAHTAKKSWSI